MHFSTSRLRRGSVVLSAALAGAVLAPVTAWAGAPASPTITAPAASAVITDSPLAVTASSAATSVQFDLGAGPIDSDTQPVVTNVATGSLEVLGVKGTVTITATDCTPTCNGTTDTVDVTVNLPKPSITSPQAKDYVRNSVDVKASAPGGTLQYSVDGNPVGLPVTAPFDKRVSLSGTLEGQHTLSVQQCNIAGDYCHGKQDSVTVIKDTKPPRWTNVRASNKTVFPVKDNYKDSTRLSARVSENLGRAKVEIRKAGGPVVRTFNLGREDNGSISVTWNGRRANGDMVPKGRYTYRFIGTDRAGLTGKSDAKRLTVSDKRLVKKHVSKTVSAWGSKSGQFAGSCSSIVRVGSGGVGLRSNSKRNGCTGKPSLALTVHKLHIGKAFKLGSAKISAYGGKTSSRPGRALMFAYSKAGDAVSLTRLGGPTKWRTCKSFRLDGMLIRGNLYWATYTANGYWYDVDKFKVTYTATYLR
jgi:hypothetical protein